MPLRQTAGIASFAADFATLVDVQHNRLGKTACDQASGSLLSLSGQALAAVWQLSVRSLGATLACSKPGETA
jgi:hypothetical protein